MAKTSSANACPAIRRGLAAWFEHLRLGENVDDPRADELRAILGYPNPTVQSKISSRLNLLTRTWVERSPFLCLATSDSEGRCDVSPRGDSAGFVRIHRSYLVSLAHVSRLRLGASSPTVLVGGTELPVSRRLLPALRDRVAANRIRPRA